MAEAEYWWASFADDAGFKGVVIVPRDEAEDMIALSRRLWMSGLNPGGEMMAACAPASAYLQSDEAWALEPDNQNRVIAPDEVKAKGYISVPNVSPEGFRREAFEADMASKTVDADLNRESLHIVIDVLRKRLHQEIDLREQTEKERDRARLLAAQLEEIVAMRTLIVRALAERNPDERPDPMPALQAWARAQLQEVP